MTFRDWKNRFLGTPWVYDTLRPLVVGGLDLGALARFCRTQPGDRIFDLGCGTAQLVNQLRFESYLGVDLDPVALARAARMASAQVRFLKGDAWDAELQRLNPTCVLMIGVVHHLSDAEFRHLVGRLREGDAGSRRLVAIDVTFFKGMAVNNLLSRLDRGRYVREVASYERLYARCRLRVARKEELPTRAGYVRYIGFDLRFS
jgi:SAM-dependent methyltransferase